MFYLFVVVSKTDESVKKVVIPSSASSSNVGEKTKSIIQLYKPPARKETLGECTTNFSYLLVIKNRS